MEQLFLFECKKILKRKTTWAAFMISVVAVIGLYFFNYSVAKDVRQGNITRLHNIIVTFQNWLSDAKSSEKGVGDMDQKDTIAHFQKAVGSWEQRKVNYSEGNWKEFYQEEINQLQPAVSQLGSVLTSPIKIEDQSISWFTLRATLAEMKQIGENDVEPFIQNSVSVINPYLSTIYDQFTGSAKKQWENGTKRYGIFGLYYL